VDPEHIQNAVCDFDSKQLDSTFVYWGWGIHLEKTQFVFKGCQTTSKPRDILLACRYLTLSPLDKLPLAKFIVCIYFRSASMSLKAG